MKTYLIIIALSGYISIQAGAATTVAPAEVAPLEGMLTRVGQADSGSGTVLTWAAEMEHNLATLNNSPPIGALEKALAAAAAAHAQKLADLERLQQELEELKNAVKQEQIHDAEIENEIAECQAKLEQAKKDLAAEALLESELLRKLQQANQDGRVSDGVAANGRKSIPVIINGNLVAPVAAPYFKGRRVRYTDGDTGLEISQVQDGVPLGKALQSGGWLTAALSNGSPDQYFVALIVSSDSIPTYYALLKELRQRKYLHVWDTWDGKPFQIITSHAPGNASSSGTLIQLSR